MKSTTYEQAKDLGSYELNERAAIMEFDGKLLRQEAEQQALAKGFGPNSETATDGNE